MGNLTYFMKREAGQPHHSSRERFSIHGADKEKVKKALLLVAASILGKTPRDLLEFKWLFTTLSQWNEIEAPFAYRILPAGMKGELSSIMNDRLALLLQQHRLGVISIDTLVHTYQEELSYFQAFDGDSVALFDSEGRSMRWNDQDEMQLYLFEADMEKELVSCGMDQDTKAQILALNLTHVHFQHSMNSDGSPKDDDTEHATYGKMGDDGQFIPVVTILHSSYLAEDQPQDD